MIFDQLNVFDYAVIVIVLLSITLGLWRGFTREFVAFIAWVLAVLCAVLFSPWLSSHLAPMIKSMLVAHVLSFFVVLGVILALGFVINVGIARMTTGVAIGFVDRPLGALFGLARGIIIAALIVLLIGHTSMRKSDWFEKSESVHYLEKVSHKVDQEYQEFTKSE